MPFGKFTRSHVMAPYGPKQRSAYSKPLNPVMRKQVRRIANGNIETKYGQFQNSGFFLGTVATGAIVTDMTPMAPGTGQSQRVGQSITPQYATFSYYTDAQATHPSTITRAVVFQFRPDNTGLTAAQVLAEVFDLGPTGVIDPWSAYNFNTRSQYKILSDKIWTQQGNLACENNIKQHKYTVSLRKCHKVQYVSGVNTGSDHIYYFVVGNQVAGANGTLYTGTERVYYKDG